MGLEVLLKNQEYLLYLIGVLVSVGVIKEHNMFADLYNCIAAKIKSKKVVIMLVSAISGVLPVPGRVTVSAGILDTIAPKHNKKARAKFGIIDYLATHHYYLWSPLEKTIIMPMAVLGLSYLEVLSYTFTFLILSIFYIIWYIFTKIDEDDIEIRVTESKFNSQRFFTGVVPMLAAIAGLMLKAPPYIVFAGLAIYYLAITATWSTKKIFGYINWNLVFALAAIIAASNFIKAHTDQVMAFVQAHNLDMGTASGFLLISLIAFGSSLLLGSSSRYAGIMVLLTTIYGLPYFAYFIALEFSGYLLSPFHKCNIIGKMYFGTPLKEYARALTGWTLLLVSYALIGLIINGFG